MKPITGDIKFFEANITHKRNGNKKHFFKNKTDAVLIDLEKFIINLLISIIKAIYKKLFFV